MVWVKDRLAALSAAWRERRYVLPSLILAVATAAALVIALLQREGINLDWVLPYAFGVLVALFLGIFWLLEYTVKLRKQIRGTRLDLSSLREEGVSLRNRGINPFPDETSWNQWKDSAERWNGRVINKIKEVNEADAIWFKTLDIVPKPRLPIARDSSELWIADREKLYGEHDFRVKRLGEMIRELWRD